MCYIVNEGIKMFFLKVYKKKYYNIEKYGGEIWCIFVVF